MFTACLALISVLTNSVSFTATATGVNKGVPIEFMFVAEGSDHDYEAMFILEDSPADLLNAFAKAGIPSGNPIEIAKARLHAVGPFLSLSPSLGEFIDINKEGFDFPDMVFSGGLLTVDGEAVCQKTSPNAVFAFFDCPQSPVLFDGQFSQGDVYGRYLAKKTLKKGEKHVFKFSWDGKSAIKTVTAELSAANSAAVLKKLKDESEKGPIAVEVSFAPDMTLAEAVLAANALQVIDSHRIKINGAKKGNFFYRSFLPLEAWRDRSQRLLQPLELYIGNDGALRLLAIDEDWSVQGNDPKLSEREIAIGDVGRYPKTDTCLIFVADKNITLEKIFDVRKKLGRDFPSWYIFNSN
jgi:hypothetical protein